MLKTIALSHLLNKLTKFAAYLAAEAVLIDVSYLVRYLSTPHEISAPFSTDGGPNLMKIEVTGAKMKGENNIYFRHDHNLIPREVELLDRFAQDNFRKTI